MLRALGAVQLDTISVLARSHELVAYARLGPVGRDAVERAYWSGGAFEYWSHAACVLPVTEWPWFAFRRRRLLARQKRWHDVHQPAVDAVRERLRTQGPLTTKELGGAKASAEWWDWSEAKIAVEWLLDVGEVACVERRGWRRVYDLADRAIPDGLRREEPSDEACLERLRPQGGPAGGGAGRACGGRSRATRRASSGSSRGAAGRWGSRPAGPCATTTACAARTSTRPSRPRASCR